MNKPTDTNSPNPIAITGVLIPVLTAMQMLSPFGSLRHGIGQGHLLREILTMRDADCADRRVAP